MRAKISEYLIYFNINKNLFGMHLRKIVLQLAHLANYFSCKNQQLFQMPGYQGKCVKVTLAWNNSDAKMGDTRAKGP